MTSAVPIASHKGTSSSPRFQHWLLQLMPLSPSSPPMFLGIETLVNMACSPAEPLEQRIEALHDLRLALHSETLDISKKLELALEVTRFVYEELLYADQHIFCPRIFALIVQLQLDMDGLGIDQPKVRGNEVSMPVLRGEYVTAAVADLWRGFVGKLCTMSAVELAELPREDQAAACGELICHMLLGHPDAAGDTMVSRRFRFFSETGLSLWNSLSATSDRARREQMQNATFHRLNGAVLEFRRRQKERTAYRTSKREIEETSKGVPASADPLLHLVIHDAFPPCKEAEARTVLERFKPLQKPLSRTPMPSEAALQTSIETLLREFPWCGQAIAAIFQPLLGRSRLGVATLSISPVLLVGSSGCGKSRFARRLAEVLGIPSMVINLAGGADHRSLVGTSRGWGSGEPTPLLNLFLQGGATAVVVVNDIDKATDTTANSPPATSALLSLLEPSEATRFHDPYLQVDCDLSTLLWIGTANTTTWMSASLLSRFRVLAVPRPTAKDLHDIVPGVCKDLERDWALPEGSIDPGGVRELLPRRIQNVRQLRAAVSSAVTHSVLRKAPAPRLH